MIIYKVINTINDKCYIGQTVQLLEKRKNVHIYDVKIKRYNSYFHNAIRKYGIENFKWVILCECNSKEKLNEKEKYYITLYNTIVPFGYNMTYGGEGTVGYKHTDYSKSKMSNNSNNNGINNPMYGKNHTDKTKEIISEKNKGNIGWCKGLTKDNDDRLKKLHEKRMKTMNENNLFYKGREHGMFKKLDENKIIEMLNNNIQLYKIAEYFNISRGTLRSRINILKEEGMIK